MGKRDDEADKALQFALQRGVDRAVVLQELGVVYLAAGKPTIAEGALRRALMLREDETQKTHALEQLVKMLESVNRPEDAKKYKKMLRKSTIVKDPQPPQ